MAIKALEREECDDDLTIAYLMGAADAKEDIRREECEDAISRSDVLDLFGHGRGSWSEQEIQSKVEALPSVTPKKQTGHWVKHFDEIRREYWHGCPKCNEHAPYDCYGKEELTDFCPSCGCQMKGDE